MVERPPSEFTQGEDPIGESSTSIGSFEIEAPIKARDLDPVTGVLKKHPALAERLARHLESHPHQGRRFRKIMKELDEREIDWEKVRLTGKIGGIIFTIGATAASIEWGIRHGKDFENLKNYILRRLEKLD